MLKKLTMLVFGVFVGLTLCGCIAAMAYMADTAKAKAEIDVSYSQAVDVVKAAMKTQDIEFVKAAIEKDILVAKGTYVDGKTVRIYVQKLSDTRCSFSVRVGMTEQGKADAEKILQAIIDYSKDINDAAGN